MDPGELIVVKVLHLLTESKNGCRGTVLFDSVLKLIVWLAVKNDFLLVQYFNSVGKVSLEI